MSQQSSGAPSYQRTRRRSIEDHKTTTRGTGETPRLRTTTEETSIDRADRRPTRALARTRVHGKRRRPRAHRRFFYYIKRLEPSVNDFTHARALWARSPPPAPGQGQAGGQPARTNRTMPDATHKAQRRGACLVPLQPQAQAPPRTATAGRAGGGIDVLGRVAGRPPLISRALHALSRRSRRRGCVVVIDLDPTLWPACFACSRTHAAVSSVDRPRATTDRAMPTSHP
jgi:hypothetical protein